MRQYLIEKKQQRDQFLRSGDPAVAGATLGYFSSP
jgi:hypothetical protein